MTICLAVMEGNKVVIAADTLEIHSDRKEYGTKLVKIKDCWIASAGLANVQFIIEGFARSTDWVENFKADTIQDIESFADEVWDALKARVKRWSEETKKEDDGGEELLIATPSKIFKADRFGIVKEVTDFAAIGSGESYALAVLKTNWDKKVRTEKRLKELALEALQVAIYYDSNCGGKSEIQVLGK